MHARFPIGRLEDGAGCGAGRLPAAANARKILTWKASRRCGQAARSSECTQDSHLEGLKAVRAVCPQQRTRPRLPIGRLQGGAGRRPAAATVKIPNSKASCKAVRAGWPQLQVGPGRLPAAANAPIFQIKSLQGGAGRLPAAANAPKIPNWKASRRCGQAARTSECTQDSQLEGFMQGGSGKLPEGFKAVRAGCPQQRTHPRFPIGAGRLRAAAKAPKIRNWKA